jgi:hypothetical protein
MAFEDQAVPFLSYHDFKCSNKNNNDDNGIPAKHDLVSVVHAIVFWVVYACHSIDGANNDGGARDNHD